MTQPTSSTSLRTFMIVWSGQLVSIIGSRMTGFATTIWAWEVTGLATSLSLVYFFTQLPSVLITPFAGVIVDRWNRKFLMVVGDLMAGLSTLAILLLYSTHQLEIWHLYITGALNGAFGQIQELAYSTSVSLMVPKQHYSRASSLEFLATYSSRIFAPALAGALYYIIGLFGILIIDLFTFLVAILTVFKSSIPQPIPSEAERQQRLGVWQEMLFGFRYIFARPSLLALMTMMSLFRFAHDLGDAVYSPMILARSGNDAGVLGSIASAAGIGGVAGALVMSTWGGPKRRINGVLLGMVGAGISKTVLGLGQNALIWIPAQFCSSFNFPFLGSSEQAIWLDKVKPAVQGRVFAAQWMSVLLASPLSFLIGGPLADYVLEPAMMPGGYLAPFLGGIFGTGAGAGMALLYVITSLSLLLIGLSGYAFPTLRDVENILPDHDATAELG